MAESDLAPKFAPFFGMVRSSNVCRLVNAIILTASPGWYRLCDDFRMYAITSQTPTDPTVH